MISGLKQHAIIKILSITLSILLVWQAVSWANPDVFRSSTVQPKTLFTGLRSDDDFTAVSADYITELLTRIESVRENRNVPGMEREITQLLRNLSGAAEKKKTGLPVLAKRYSGSGEIILQAPGYFVRYYNPNLHSHDLSGSEAKTGVPEERLKVVEDKKIGRYFSKQIMVVKEIEDAPSEAMDGPAGTYDPAPDLEFLRTLTFLGDGPTEASKIYGRFMKWSGAMPEKDRTSDVAEACDYVSAKVNWIFRMSSIWDEAEGIIKRRMYGRLDNEEKRKVENIGQRLLEEHNRFMGGQAAARDMGNEIYLHEALSYVSGFCDRRGTDLREFSATHETSVKKSEKPADTPEKTGDIKTEEIKKENTAGKLIRSINLKRLGKTLAAAVMLSAVLYMVLPVNTFTLTAGFILPLALFVFLIVTNFTWKGLFTALVISALLSIFLPLPWIGLSFAIIIAGQMVLRGKAAGNVKHQETPAQPVQEVVTASKTGISSDILEYMNRLLVMKYGEAKPDENDTGTPGTITILGAVFNIEPGSLKPDTAKTRKELVPIVKKMLAAIERGFDFQLLKAIETIKNWRLQKDEELADALNELAQEIAHETLGRVSHEEEGGHIIAVEEIICAHYGIPEERQELILARQFIDRLRERVASDEIIGKHEAFNYYTLGRLEFHFGNIPAAEQNFEKAVRHDKANGDYRFSLGLFKHYLKKIEEAEKSYMLYLSMLSGADVTEEVNIKRDMAKLLLKKASQKVALDGTKISSGHSFGGEQPGAGSRIGKQVKLVGIETSGKVEKLKGEKVPVAKVEDSKGATHEIELTRQADLDVAGLKGTVRYAHSVSEEHKNMLLAVLERLENSPPEFYTYSTLVEDLFGFASPGNNMIALHESLTQADTHVIALLHEIMEYLVKSGELKIGFHGVSLYITDKDGILFSEVVLSDKDALKQAHKGAENPHYLLRALQREIFGAIDVTLTKTIKENIKRDGEAQGQVEMRSAMELGTEELLDLVEADEAWKPTGIFSAPGTRNIPRAGKKAKPDSIKSIEKNAERTIDSLVEAFMAATVKDEKVILALDTELGKGEINTLLKRLLEIFPDLENNNEALKMFLSNLEIIQGKGEVLASRLSNITDPERGRVKAENVLIVAKNSNLGYFAGLEGKATITAIDDSSFPGTSYLPLVEILLFTVGKYLGWDEETLNRHYEMIPNVIARNNLAENELSLLFGGSKTMVIRLIPDAEELGVDGIRDLMNNIKIMLARA